ncbi:MAG: lytic transglycosylase domain-containing protein [Bacteroidetes bacterium]|nr:lytic transglycosylase domain-containing protein [Bacteroidota bacterium]
MKTLRSKILYFLFPFLLLGGSIVLIGSVQSGGNNSLKSLGSHATMLSLDPPSNLNFAGEMVPLRDFEVKERFDQEMVKYSFLHSATIMNIRRAARWRPEISAILRKQGIPEDFFYLCIAESHLTNASSPAGAKGFWQFLEGTAKVYGLEVSEQVDERFDPIKSTEAACQYLKDAHKIFHNWTLVAASYNMGMGGLRKQMERQRVNSYYDLYLNRETSSYVFAILAIKTILEEPVVHGFEIAKHQLYAPLQYNLMTVDTTIPDLIDWSLTQGTTYKSVRVLNPWILGDKLVIPKAKEGEPQKSYRIKVPKPGSAEDQGQELIPRILSDSITLDSLPPSPHGGSSLDADPTEKAPAKTSTPTKKKKQKGGK